VLELVGVGRGSVTGDFQWVIQRQSAGELYVDMSRLVRLGAGSGSLLELTFRVSAEAQPGTVDLDLTWVSLNEGRLTLTPRPQAGKDGSDGEVRIAGAEVPPAEAVVEVPDAAPGTGTEAAAAPVAVVEEPEAAGSTAAEAAQPSEGAPPPAAADEDAPASAAPAADEPAGAVIVVSDPEAPVEAVPAVVEPVASAPAAASAPAPTPVAAVAAAEAPILPSGIAAKVKKEPGREAASLPLEAQLAPAVPVVAPGVAVPVIALAGASTAQSAPGIGMQSPAWLKSFVSAAGPKAPSVNAGIKLTLPPVKPVVSAAADKDH
jgi:hypothetical protein